MTMTARRKRLTIIFGILVAAGAATALVLNAFKSNLVFFYSPSQVVAHEAPEHRLFRIGGLVLAGSLQREGVDVRFTVTDLAHAMPVRYHGSLPDLFKEGKGVVAQGRLGADGVFVAQEVFAKHDENYMPPEAADALKRAQANGAKGMATPGQPDSLVHGAQGAKEGTMAMEQKR